VKPLQPQVNGGMYGGGGCQTGVQDGLAAQRSAWSGQESTRILAPLPDGRLPSRRRGCLHAGLSSPWPGADGGKRVDKLTVERP